MDKPDYAALLEEDEVFFFMEKESYKIRLDE